MSNDPKFTNVDMSKLKTNTEDCEHKFVYIDSKKWISRGGYRPFEYTKVNRFFCEKCLQTKEIERKEVSWGEPDWY